MTNFYPNTLPTSTSQLVTKLEKKNPQFLQDFYLSGGTALSLQLGHRESEDLDFFSQNDFNPDRLLLTLETFGRLNNTALEANTLNTEIDGVKLQFLGYPYPLIEEQLLFGNIRLSSVLDIALTKLQTIGMRGSRKDFIDIYKILEDYDLKFLIQKMRDKYPHVNYNLPHILKSLVYFEDAESEPMPRLHQDISWSEVRQKITARVQKIDFLN